LEGHQDLPGPVDQAAKLLATVLGQDLEPDPDHEGGWRIARRVAKDRVISTVDPDSRHMHKSVSSYRDGYKAHVSVEPVTGLICAQRLTPANAPDGPTAVELMAGEPPKRQVLADGAYGSGPTRFALRQRRHRLAIKPWPTVDTGRFGRDDFRVDHHARTVTCPAGHTVTLTAANNATFDRHCNQCPLRPRCTTARDGRSLRLRPYDAELVEARRAWRDGDFAHDYRRWRPMVERSLAWLVRPGRRVAYRGTTRNRIWLAHRAAAINLQRLVKLGLRHHSHWQLAT
jgi:hypothetical protein